MKHCAIEYIIRHIYFKIRQNKKLDILVIQTFLPDDAVVHRFAPRYVMRHCLPRVPVVLAYPIRRPASTGVLPSNAVLFFSISVTLPSEVRTLSSVHVPACHGPPPGLPGAAQRKNHVVSLRPCTIPSLYGIPPLQ